MNNIGKYIFFFMALSVVSLTACEGPGDGKIVVSQTAIQTSTVVTSGYALRNPYLADSVAPIGHINSAQSTGVSHAGPSGPSEALSIENGGLTYTHLGPAHFGYAISPEYANGKRVIWSNGGDRISKLDYDSLQVIDEFFLEDSPANEASEGAITSEQADADIRWLDLLPKWPYTGLGTLFTSVPMVKKYLGAGLAGVYYLASSDNVLYVGGKNSILAYADADPQDPQSRIVLKNEWVKPPEITGGFNSMNMTYDGWLVSITDDGWVVLISRDFSEYQTMQLTGAEVAPAWNQKMLDMGRRQGAATWIRNGPAIDEYGNIFVPSLQHMHKIIWNGEKLSRDEADGAWVVPYSNDGEINVTLEDVLDPDTGKPYTFVNVNSGTGSTASLMGFGNEDKFVVITDGDEVMNMVLFWREDIPDDWQQIDGAPSRRIAGMLRADIGRDDAEAVQTEQSVVVSGYGAMVVNNAPASVPLKQVPAGAYIGLAGHHPDFTPYGIQKFAWDPAARELREAWVNKEVSSANSVPIVSAAANKVYTVGAREGKWTLEALDWTSGQSAFYYETGSSRFNTLFSGVMLDQEGRAMHTTFHGIVRYERPPD
ncbi:MAG: hypothetical protein P8P79_09725 [Halioglobus sp.]|nr:hypothetical protein [Halioglobus sp.]